MNLKTFSLKIVFLFLNAIGLKNICDKGVDTHPSTIKYVLECSKLKKCVIKQLINACCI